MTGRGRYTGTDDHVYLGVYGPEGGREFALDVAGFDDWEPDSSVDYRFGSGGGAGRDPRTAEDQLYNISISTPDITHVYLRKQGDRTRSGDDYWELSDATVYLFPRGSGGRVFTLPGTARLGNEYGHKVWLEERTDGTVHADDPTLKEVRAKFEQDQE
ncbi:hypothetical protein [Halobacteriaceae bacterium SHR40]|uniref:hypothetical protein n=1 Tax=Halovenus amylolytica TaxID=2500550 RepID=UPI000FE3C2C3